MPFTRKLNVVNPDDLSGDMAGLLAYPSLACLPITPKRDSGLKNQEYKRFTATGIAPDLHRTSLLMAPLMARANQIGTNVGSLVHLILKTYHPELIHTSYSFTDTCD